MSDRKAPSPSLSEIAREQQKVRPTYFEDPAADRALALLLETAEALCVARDRLDTVQRLVDQGVEPADPAIDGFEITPELEARRLERHRALFENLFRRLGAS